MTVSLSIRACTAGWAPSAFRSSRGSKTEFSGQKPEDFMDEEVNFMRSSLACMSSVLNHVIKPMLHGIYRSSR